MKPSIKLNALVAVLVTFLGLNFGSLGFAVQNNSDLLLAEQNAFRQAVVSAAECVVQIETFGGLDKADRQATAEGPTTGTIVHAEGWIVTSLYSFKQMPASTLVTLPAGNRVPARVVARDYSRELVLLKVEASEPLPVAVPSEMTVLKVGQWCVAVGKTYDSRSVTQSVGIVSALGRAYGRAVQTDAKVSPINYGGPLVDLNGKVIGILTPIAAAEMLEDDGTVLYDSGIGFAIPLTDILQRLPKLQAGKDIRSGKLGIVSQGQNELAGPVRLSGAAPGTPAAKAGAKPGDVIIAAGDRPVELLADLRSALAQVDAEEPFQFTVRRGSQKLVLSCDLVAEVPVYRRRYLGIQVEPVEDGLRIASIDDKSPAKNAGLEVGNILTSCNGQPMRQRSDLVAVLAVAELDSSFELAVKVDATAVSKSIKFQPTTWPTAAIEHQPRKLTYTDGDGKDDPNAKSTLTPIKLPDIPNQIYAILPPQPNRGVLGCLVFFPEPGPVDQEKLKSNWEEFAKNYGWIIVVPTSDNAKAWSRDEATELPERLIARFSQEYKLDVSRTVVGGTGIGGQVALRAALGANRQFAAVLTIGTPLRPFPISKPNMPLETIDFLFVGPKAEPVVELLKSMGFVAGTINPPGLDASKWSTVPMEAIVKWLESLGHI